MTAREAILTGLKRPVPVDLAAQAAALVAGNERPPEPVGTLAERFARRLDGASVAATIERVAAMDGVPAAVARYLDEQGLAAVAAELYLPPDPAVRELDWSGVTATGLALSDQPAALAVAKAAVAESGSLIFETSPVAPMLPNFLTLHHIVVVRAEMLVDRLEDIPTDLAGSRAHYWVTGVSGTTDIEGQYVRGAHGPRFLHVVLVG
ncbi:LUD domain-containing protein [Sphingomonas sp. CFBP 13720]|uniref:LUD domain-containing protein n=1 Tax=Sphingomonas sp. CFBP 13720 TaxID=2775302 RepID=UPI001784007C|nr:LUD domain-containing protein [Sphingomonas sp. CFBP 13720]MBD8677008.1 LUD domain-containing protein [Sphingomonas sp. CFBP 13720]